MSEDLSQPEETRQGFPLRLPDSEISSQYPWENGALARLDTDGNERIVCAKARRRSGTAPRCVEGQHPAYLYMRDGDGVVCE